MYTPSRSFDSSTFATKQSELGLLNLLGNLLGAAFAVVLGFFNPGNTTRVPAISVWSNRLLLIYAIPLFFIFGAMAIPMLVVYQLFFHVLIQMALRFV